MKSQRQVAELENDVDFIGFIFYPGSPRFVTETPVTSNVKRTGIFVNDSAEVILSAIKKHRLDIVQLHGSEDVELCRIIRKHNPVIKAFGMNENFDFKMLLPFEGSVDYFLFDTKTPKHGGSGKQFDWSILDRYHLSTPFFISGGINKESLKPLKQNYHPQMAGVDLNSGFEFSPANKDVLTIKQFIYELSQRDIPAG